MLRPIRQTMGRNLLTTLNHNSNSPLLTNTLTPYFMWLIYSLLITLILAHSSLPVIDTTQSSNHLHPYIDFVRTTSHLFTNMCFTQTKTLKLLRERNHTPDSNIDLGFNWEDNCNYLPFDCIETFATYHNDLRIVQLNIRGLKGKLDELGDLLGKLKHPDVVILNETWLKDTDTNRIKLNNYVFSGIPRLNKKGGGVGFLIRGNLSFRQRPDLEMNEHTHPVNIVVLK